MSAVHRPTRASYRCVNELERLAGELRNKAIGCPASPALVNPETGRVIGEGR